MFLSHEDIRVIASKIIGRSKAESCTVSIGGGDSCNFRFAGNEAKTNGAVSKVGIFIKSSFGRRSGSATVNALDEGALEQAQARSEEIARVAPEDPEFMPPLPPQTYEQGVPRFDPATAEARPADLARLAKSAIEAGSGRDVAIAGYVESSQAWRALANSAGLFAFDRETGAQLTVSARNRLRACSGWAGASQYRLAALDAAQLGERAVKKAVFQGDPADLDPGRYTVILEPAAVADLVSYLVLAMDARSADEGRSFLARAGGGTKLNEQLLSQAVTITSDPADPVVPETLYGSDGVPKRRTVWFEQGIARSVSVSRFWAQKTGCEPVPRPSSLSMAGGPVSLDEMISGIKRGILVTRLWYINLVDPRTLLCTGMTRDGNFLIENGRITHPARNLRFNESPVSALSNIEAAGPAERTIGDAGNGSGIYVPPLLIKDFTFSSKSSGI